MSNTGVRIKNINKHTPSLEKLNDDTEKLIFQAATRVLLRNGLDATTMQQIADEAGISRTALHYYYRSKHKLFQAVLVNELDRFLPRITHIIMDEKLSLEEKLKAFIENYVNLLKAHPYLPMFIASALHSRQEAVLIRQIKLGENFNRLLGFLQLEMGAHIDHDTLLNFIMDLMGMLIFPIMARPLLRDQLLADEDNYDTFIEARKDHVFQIMKRFFT